MIKISLTAAIGRVLGGGVIAGQHPAADLQGGGGGGGDEGTQACPAIE